METFEATNAAPPPKPQSEKQFPEVSSLDSVTHINGLTEESLSKKFESVGVGSNEGEEEETNGNDHGGALHPLRPYAEDCPHYLRTGTCKFGLNCRFNHPVRRANQKVGKEKEKVGKAKEGSSEKTEKIECKYYLTAEGCKYGKLCRYNHSKVESEIATPELNFLGLPMRVGEKECPFYMRNGSCGYGPGCKFHHPDPTDVGGYDPHSSTESVVQYSLPPVNYNGESSPLYVSGVTQPAQASWSTHILSDKAVPYQDNHTSYMPTMHYLPQESLQTPEWNGYQAPNFPDERTRPPISPLAAMSLTNNAYVSRQVEEYPERPGLPECDYFVRTGTCKYKSACRYHHPKNPAPKADCVLSDKGLPLRPGKKICWHYEKLGICKFGRACLFDHPVNHS